MNINEKWSELHARLTEGDRRPTGRIISAYRIEEVFAEHSVDEIVDVALWARWRPPNDRMNANDYRPHVCRIVAWNLVNLINRFDDVYTLYLDALGKWPDNPWAPKPKADRRMPRPPRPIQRITPEERDRRRREIEDVIGRIGRGGTPKMRRRFGER